MINKKKKRTQIFKKLFLLTGLMFISVDNLSAQTVQINTSAGPTTLNVAQVFQHLPSHIWRADEKIKNNSAAVFNSFVADNPAFVNKLKEAMPYVKSMRKK